jgi:hypothetical protein
MFRLSQNADGAIVDVTTFQQLLVALLDGKRGRFRIDEITCDSAPFGRTSRRWGVGIKRADGSIAIERDPWPDSR